MTKVMADDDLIRLLRWALHDSDLIRLLRRALHLTKLDAERNGFKYGKQSTCQKALDAVDRWEARNAKHNEKT